MEILSLDTTRKVWRSGCPQPSLDVTRNGGLFKLRRYEDGLLLILKTRFLTKTNLTLQLQVSVLHARLLQYGVENPHVAAVHNVDTALPIRCPG